MKQTKRYVRMLLTVLDSNYIFKLKMLKKNYNFEIRVQDFKETDKTKRRGQLDTHMNTNNES